MKKFPPTGNYKEIGKLKINFTYLTKQWCYNEKKTSRDLNPLWYAQSTNKVALTFKKLQYLQCFTLRTTEHAAFHTKPLCVPGEKLLQMLRLIN